MSISLQGWCRHEHLNERPLSLNHHHNWRTRFLRNFPWCPVRFVLDSSVQSAVYPVVLLCCRWLEDHIRDSSVGSSGYNALRLRHGTTFISSRTSYLYSGFASSAGCPAPKATRRRRRDHASKYASDTSFQGLLTTRPLTCSLAISNCALEHSSLMSTRTYAWFALAPMSRI